MEKIQGKSAYFLGSWCCKFLGEKLGVLRAREGEQNGSVSVVPCCADLLT